MIGPSSGKWYLIQLWKTSSSKEIRKIDNLLLYFNQNLLKSLSTHKDLGIVLNTKLDFNLHLKKVQNKANKTIDILCKFQNALPRTWGIKSVRFSSKIKSKNQKFSVMYNELASIPKLQWPAGVKQAKNRPVFSCTAHSVNWQTKRNKTSGIPVKSQKKKLQRNFSKRARHGNVGK